MDIWEILGIAFTTNKRDIKRAYAKLTKKYHPETDPEGFKKINDAYKQALIIADQGVDTANDSFVEWDDQNERTIHVEGNEQEDSILENSILAEAETKKQEDLFEDIVVQDKIRTDFNDDTTLTLEERKQYDMRLDHVCSILDKEILGEQNPDLHGLMDLTSSELFKSIYKNVGFIVILIHLLDHRNPVIEIWQHFYDIYKPLIQESYYHYRSEWYKKLVSVTMFERVIMLEHKPMIIKLIKSFGLVSIINIVILIVASENTNSTSNNWLLLLFPVLCIVPNALFSTRYKATDTYSMILKFIWILYLIGIVSPILLVSSFEYGLSDTPIKIVRVISVPLIAMECVYFFNYFDYLFSDIYLETKLSYLKRRTPLLVMITLSITIQYIPFSDEDMMVLIMKFLWMPIVAMVVFYIVKMLSILFTRKLEKFLIYSIWEVKDKIIALAFYMFLVIKHIVLLTDIELIINRIGLFYYIGMVLADVIIVSVINKQYRPLEYVNMKVATSLKGNT